MQLRYLLPGMLVALACEGNISGSLPKFDINGLSDQNFDIVWSGAVPRRVTIVPSEPFKTRNTSLSSEKINQVALDFIKQNSAFLRSQGAAVRVELANSDGAHHHAYLAQTLNGRPVFNAGIDIFFTDDLQLEVVHNQLVPALSGPVGGEVSSQDAAVAALGILPVDSTLASAPAPVLGYEVINGQAVPMYRVRMTTENPDTDQLVLVHAITGDVVEVRDLLTDVTARGNVFPRSNRAAGNFSQVSFEVDGSGFLRSSAIDAQVGSGSRASSAQAAFNFTPTDARFGETNTFFHLQSLTNFLTQNNIRFITERFPVRVRGVPTVNAFYDPSRRRIVLGNDQGVDLSFDGDVAVHEYGHALLDRIRPGLLGSSPEAGAIHEAFGDMLTMYFFENPDITEGFALDVAEKLGTSFYDQICPGFTFSVTRPRCRSGENDFVYPQDLRGEVHFDSMMLSGALWEVFEAMVASEGNINGKNRAIKTAVRAAAFLPSANARFTDFLAGMIEADRALNAGKYRGDIVDAFLRHGITRPDIFQCSTASECEGGDACEQGFCSAGDPQPQACSAAVDCGDASLKCDAGMCVPSAGGAFALAISANGLPAAIPDNNQAGVAINIDVPVDLEVRGLRAEVNVAHSFSGDLTVSLVSPQGQVVILQDREGGSANDINKTFDVIGLNTQNGKGSWTLRIIDRGPLDTGAVQSFSLFFN
jgi:Zn-dependent metalloprotease